MTYMIIYIQINKISNIVYQISNMLYKLSYIIHQISNIANKRVILSQTGPEFKKFFFMINTTKHEIFSAQKS